MSKKVFYETRTLKRYTVVFESREVIVGADRRKKRKLFPKDTGAVAFSRREALEFRFSEMTRRSSAEEMDNEALPAFDGAVLGFNFG